MTTFLATTATADSKKGIAQVNLGQVALWTGQVVIAVAFLLAGGSKLAGAPAMVGLFNAIGIGQWFRYVTGVIEVGSAIALLVPSLAPYGSLALAATMTGAVFAQLFVVGASPLPALVLGAGSAAIAWARRDQF
jgi:putative oxidoreductase